MTEKTERKKIQVEELLCENGCRIFVYGLSCKTTE